MSIRLPLISAVVAVTFALITSAFFVQPALADDGDGTPPVDTPALTEGESPAEEDVAVEGEPAESPVATDEMEVGEGDETGEETAPAEVSDASESEEATEETAPAEESEAEDSEPASDEPAEPGEPEEGFETDLEAEISEATIGGESGTLAADPIWCPSSVSTPVSGGSGCTASYASLEDLINFLNANQPSVAGTIWIEKTYDSSVNDAGETVFTLNGATLTTMANAALTIKGGWNGIGTNTIDLSSPSLFYGARLEILNWNNSVTISDVEFLNGPAGTALVVETTGKITLLRTTTDNSTGTGASLNNTFGTGDVSVTNSAFGLSISGDGLEVRSNGAVTLNGVQAFGNDNYGAYIDNSEAVSAKAVTIVAGVNEFSDNGAGGLVVISKGTISIKDLTTIGNGGDGANLDNRVSLTAQGIMLSGTNVFGDNGGSGLEARSFGPITANNLIANANGGLGVLLDNESAATAQPVKLTGNNEFKYNVSRGLYVRSLGLIVVNNLDVQENNNIGATLFNNTSPTNQPVTMTGVNNFIGNAHTGLQLLSAGVVTLNNVTASDNGIEGVEVANHFSATPRAVIINGKLDTSRNGDNGAYIESNGSITITNLTANQNGDAGAEIYNYSAPSAQAITIKGPVGASDNGGTGLYIFSKGVISLGNVTADDNGGGGAALDNTAGAAAVLVTGTNSFSGNGGGNGLSIYGNGAITVSNVTASDNSGSGADLINVGGVADILVSGQNEFSNNGGFGLFIQGRKNITIQNIDANDNTVSGLYADNDEAGSVGKVTVAATIKNWINSFSGNGDDGVAINSRGAVTLASVMANGNGDFGATVVNNLAATAQAVIITGVNEFESNGNTGLLIQSKGAVTVNSLTALENENHGVDINNSFGGAAAPQNVTLNGYVEVGDNFYSGMQVYTFGTIAVTNLTAYYNGLGELDDNDKYGYGALLQNQDGTTAKAVTLKGIQEVDGNWTGGLVINSIGAISISNLSAYGNEGFGAKLDNSSGTGANAIILTGSNEFGGNGGLGLEVDSRGAVTISNLISGYNGGNGVDINNTYGGPASQQNVTLTGYVELYSNFYSGLEVFSNGTITVTNIWADGNGWGEPDDNDKYGYGALLDNNSGTAPRSVILKIVASKSQPLVDNGFVDNWTGGLSIESKGAITVANLYASGNEAYGVNLNNNFAGAVGGVSLTGYADIYSSTDGYGLNVDSRGLITLANADISGNNYYGARLDNSSGTLGVILTGTNIFDGNSETGLIVITKGAILANNLEAWNNAGSGAEMNNTSGTGTVTLTGNASFGYNGGFGLDAVSNRAITISATLLAGANGSSGVYLDNTALGNAQPYNISLNGATNEFYVNGGDGLELYSNGVVTAKNLVAEGNAHYGVRIENDNAVTPKAVTLIGPVIVNVNGWDGLHVYTHGAVKLQDITANYNSLNGVRIDNQNAGAVGGVAIGGTNTFTGNLLNGLVILSNGAVTLNNLRAESNGDNGVAVNSESLNTAAVPVKITGVNVFNNNGEAGLLVLTDSAITASNLTAIGNGFDGPVAGVYLDNYTLWNSSSVIAQPTITLTGANLFKDNMGVGMYFNSKAAVTLSRVTADANTSHGLDGETDGTITISCGSMTLNGGNGWRLRSWLNLNVTLKGVYGIANTLSNGNLLGGVLVIARSC